MRLILLLLKYLFMLLCLVGGIGYGQSLWCLFAKVSENPGVWLFPAGGALSFFLAYLFYFSRRESFWSVMEHELTHAVFALLFFKKIHSFSAHRFRGGKIQLEGGNFIIALAPYFFPTFTIFLFLLKPILNSRFHPYLNFAIGFTLMFHWVYLTREFHFGQPDIRQSGRIFSIIVVIFGNIFFAGMVLAATAGSFRDGGQFIRLGFRHSVQFLQYLLSIWPLTAPGLSAN